MSLKRRTLPYLALLLFISISLTSCTPPAVINVSCDVADLIDAINDANADSDTTKLILDPNCTYPFDAVDNTDGGQGPNGLPIVTTKIVIEGNNASLDRISGSYGPSFRFFFITDSGNLRLEDITLRKGFAVNSAGEPANSRGGAIFNDGGGLRAERSLFIYNKAQDGEGGAIYNRGILTLDETTFQGNRSGNGGAIYNGGTTNIAAVLQGVTFDFNLATLNGGAIYNASAEAGFMIVGSTFYWNRSYEHGGVIYMEAGDLYVSSSEFLESIAGRFINRIGDGGVIYSQAGDVTLITTNFNLQKAYGVGGILYAGPGSNVRLREVRSEDSKACHGGGALYIEGETEILETTLKENVAGFHNIAFRFETGYFEECFDYPGGAIYNTGTLAIARSLIEDSYAHGEGDGIYNLGDLSIVNSTFDELNYFPPREAINNQGNAQVIFSTLMRAALVNSGTMDVKNIVVAENSGGCINSGTFVGWGENIALDSTCPFSNIFAYTYELGIDTSLSDNGGPTLTHHVDDDSPLIDKVRCLTIAGDQVIKDQRGVYRPHPLSGDIYSCDIGAYEVHYLSPPPPPPSLPPTPTLGDPSDDPSDECPSFEGLEISVLLLNVPADTLILPLYLKIPGGVPGMEGPELWEYRALLGEIESYQCGLQGFDDRLYCMFNLPPEAPGMALDLKLFVGDCEDPAYSQPKVTIPKPQCHADLEEKACKVAGGEMSSGDIPNPECICP